MSVRLPASQLVRLPAQWVIRVVRRQDKHPLSAVKTKGTISSECIAAYYAFSFSFVIKDLER